MQKPLKKSVIIDTSVLFKRIDELYSFMNESSKKRDILLKDVFKDEDKHNRKTKRMKDYQVIYQMLLDEFGGSFSKTTIWRIIKIKERDETTYQQVKNGNISIRNGYDQLFSKFNSTQDNNITEQKNVQTVNNENIICNEMNLQFNSLNKVLTQVYEYLNEQEEYIYKTASEKELKEIDTTLFKLRKLVGVISLKNIKENEDL